MIAFSLQYVWSGKLAAPGPVLHLCARSSGLIIPAGPKIRAQCLDWEPIQRLNTLLLGEECKMYPNLNAHRGCFEQRVTLVQWIIVYSNCLSKIIRSKIAQKIAHADTLIPMNKISTAAPVCLRLPLRFSHGFGPSTPVLPILPKETSKTTGDWGGRCFYLVTIKYILSYTYR